MQRLSPPDGVLVTRALPAPPEAFGTLHPDERRFAETLPPPRRTTWVGGRLALRAALARLGALPEGPILATERGAPALPAGVAGSISHKAAVAVALAMRADGWTIGVDVEERVPRHAGIARHVLTPHEQDEIGALPEAQRGDAVLLRFSLKEAIYKAIDPWLGRLIGFHEVEVEPLADGGARLGLALVHGERPDVAAWWQVEGGLIVTRARARMVA